MDSSAVSRFCGEADFLADEHVAFFVVSVFDASSLA